MRNRFGFGSPSLLWKILLSTSVALTALFGVTGWIVQNHVINTTSLTLEEEVSSSFQAYESLWKSRAEKLGLVSLILSGMSDVRAAFSTGDQATIRDTAGELWAKISDENALFLVTDPRGRVIASLGGIPGSPISRDLPVVRAAASQFPRQAAGFMEQNGHLYQIAVTPVYVESTRGPALFNVLVAGYAIDALVAGQFKKSTGGSEFLFFSGGRVIASTLNPRATAQFAENVSAGWRGDSVSDGVFEYAPLRKPLIDVEGKPVGELWILRSFESARQRISALRREMVLTWLCAVIVGLALTFLLARRIVEPVNQLDRAAAEVARQNYDFRLSVRSDDELGRLARTFNAMCDSIRSARAELIRQERIATIGRLSSSIVHDLRNPLAAIYGGAEMLVDTELSTPQMKRLAANIYRASRRIQELLQDLVNVSRGKREASEICNLREVVEAACEASASAAESQGVTITFDPSEEVELPIERARMERVFLNLIGNALEAMPEGGAIHISEKVEGDFVLIRVTDTGPGILPSIRARLFEPFVSAGKKNGLGLGLALSRQTVLDHGGEISVEDGSPGARFAVRLPLHKTGQPRRLQAV
ncbi:MAG TPA: ATP-binding protein [Bryobacteraceae bacterium]|jgi:signal transduction histidine kinase|nr:ATP-binding protein [Bryobacteraceae bacterium]